jgi:hypothetical protein
MFVRQLMEASIERRFKDWTLGKYRTDGFAPILPGNEDRPFVGFSIPVLFEIKDSGEYTLSVQICLIEELGNETTSSHPKMDVILLPEMSTKVQIRAGVPTASQFGSGGL